MTQCYIPTIKAADFHDCNSEKCK